MKTVYTPEREAFTGDPSAPVVTGATSQTESALVALYSFNFLCPIGTPPGGQCQIGVTTPVYPKGAAQDFAAVATGSVRTAEPDDTGTMLWENAVASVDPSSGFVTFNPRDGPGLYQV